VEKERLKQDLQRLREELERNDALDPAARERLEAVTRDIETLLAGKSDSEKETLVDRLRASADHFEESHPTLTAAVGRIADALAALGI
jgi:hypothetical protein